MKRLVIIGVVLMLAVVVAACGGSSSTDRRHHGERCVGAQSADCGSARRGLSGDSE